jgi:hypothetical protein
LAIAVSSDISVVELEAGAKLCGVGDPILKTLDRITAWAHDDDVSDFFVRPLAARRPMRSPLGESFRAIDRGGHAQT